jgi:hypothetical protein
MRKRETDSPGSDEADLVASLLARINQLGSLIAAKGRAH